MKALRVWLLVLLAIALPMRGAMAAAMLCAPGGGAHAHVTAGPSAPMPVTEGHAHDHAGAALSHAHGAADHASSAGHDADEKCGFCASCCSVSIPVTATLVLPQAPPAAQHFPEDVAPIAEFFPGGQERPPRSI